MRIGDIWVPPKYPHYAFTDTQSPMDISHHRSPISHKRFLFSNDSRPFDTAMKTVLLILVLLQSPEDLFKAANADMDAQRWAEAAAKFERVLKDDPTHIPTEFDLAVCYAKLGNTARAEQVYRAILEQDPTIYEAQTNLAILLYQAGKAADAEEQFGKAAKLRPQDAAPVLYLARLLEKRGDAIGAGTSYEHALQLTPDDADAQLAAGLFYLRAQQAEKAYLHLTIAERLGLGSAQLFIALSEAEHALKHEDKSILYLEQAFKLDSNDNVRRQLGSAYRESGELDKAIETLQPLGSDHNFELALAYFDKKDFEKAAALLQALAVSEPSDSDYLDLLGESQMELKHYPEAVVTLQQALKISPDDVDALRTLGSSYFSLEDWPHAIFTWEHYIQLKPRQALGYFFAAVSYDKLGNVPQALLNYNKFIEFDDGSDDPRSFQVRQRAKALARRPNK